MRAIRLGVNIDHVATIRNARGGQHPDPTEAALVAQRSGADGITAHLREDRRHIRDEDIYRLKQAIDIPLNFEMAATDEMLSIALDVEPHAVCLVPEKREELTTEGGLDVIKQQDQLKPIIKALQTKNIKVSLFIDPEIHQIEASAQLNTDIVELHTGVYCTSKKGQRARELETLQIAASVAAEYGIECHAGHGLDYDTVASVAAIPQIVELNIGHFLIGQAIYEGLDNAIKHMRSIILKR